MKHKYADIEMRPATVEMIHLINKVIDNYLRQGFRLSVRQLYYQLVARALIENTEQSYKRVAKIINDGRMAGMIDWDAIEDRNRDIEVRSRWGSGSEIVRGCANQFHMDMWQGQDTRVFVIVEKAALAGVLDSVCREYDVPLLAARGYPSVTIVRDLALQHLRPAIRSQGQRVIVIHMGDHDPSGIDMTRDLEERIETFVGSADWHEFGELRRLALNMPQIEELQPPPNPAKTTDSRFREYMQRYGDESWELDALEPALMVQLIRDEIVEHIDSDRWKRREDEIDNVKDNLSKTADQYEEQGL